MPLKILLADDSMTAQKMAKEILTTAGYEVTAVSNGAVAAKKLADKPDIIILDVFMPGYSGLELCEKIRASMDLAKTPVLLTVGKMEPYKAEDGQKVKADGVIVKPFEATDLLAAVQKLADKIAEDAKPKTKSGAYEKTMIFKSPQIVEEFKDESYAEWKSEADEAAETRPMQMSSEMGSAPAFGADMMAESPGAAAPASEPPTFETAAPATFETPTPVASEAPAFDYASAPAFDVAPATESAAAAPAVPADENVAFAQRISPSETPRRKRNTAEINAGAAIAAAAANAPVDALESAPSLETPAPVAEADLTPVESQSLESLLERTSEPSAGSTATSAPPEMEFTGSQQTRTEEVEITPDPGLDRGEASYGSPVQDPALETDATKLVSEFPTKFGTSEPEATLEAEPSAATAMSGYDTGEPATAEATSSSAEAESATSSTPSYEDTQKITAPVEVEAIDQAKASQEPPPGMHDAELVEQMQAAFANLPVATTPQEEHSEVAAAPADTSVPTPPTVSASGRPDLELASALAAAVGGDAAPPATAEAPAAGDETTHRVVTRVLERMLPSIMAELAKEMEAAKKK